MSEQKITGSEAILRIGQELYGSKFNLQEADRRDKYKQLYFYFSGSDQSPFNPEKGILITGGLGVGKTAMMRVFQRMFGSFKRAHAKFDIEDNIKELGEVEVKKMYGYSFQEDLFIDDIGTDKVDLLLWKNQINIVGDILLERYELYIESHTTIKTHAATNLTTNQVEEMYGSRNFDRMKEMFNLIQWPGKSLRK